VKAILKNIYLLLLRVIPENRFGDNLVAFITFLRTHRRLPTHTLLLNDVLYEIKTTNEIIDPLRVFVSDKEFVKTFVSAVVGDQYNVPTIKVLHTITEVQNYAFPPDCCIKPTHLCGEVILRRQNEPVDLEKIDSWFSSSHYHVNREANYKTLKPKVIVEPLIFGSNNLNDYKVLCYNGKPKLIQVDIDRYQDHVRNYYDPDWNKMPFTLVSNSSRLVELEKPKNLDKMLLIAGSLSKYFGLVRIDLYSNGEECLVGEITNSHGNACEKFTPKSAERIASNMIFGKS
jgi:hypothetical protein